VYGFLSVLPLLLATQAQAETITLTKQGMIMPYVWVDGAAYGRIKKKEPIVATVSSGPHEIWVAYEDSGTVTHCHGVAEAGSTVNIRMMGCDGVTPGWTDKTFFRGASATFTVASGVDAWASVDGGQALAFGNGWPVELNLRPGQHNVVLYTDVMKSSVFDQGVFTLAAGQTLPITCTTAGCMGFDQPPIILLINNQPPPGISINVPGVSVSVGLPAVNINVGTSQGSAVQTSGVAVGAVAPASSSSSSGGSSSGSCCVNGAYYACPSADAVYQCTGRLMECQTGCMMNGGDDDCVMGCFDRYPPDPSACSRAPSKDNSCHD